MDMRLAVDCICRGTGAIYITFAFSLKFPANEVSFSAFSEKGLPLPLETYEAGRMRDGRRRITIVSPMLDTRSILITVEERDAAGSLVSISKKSFSRFFIKWASRFYYRFNREKAMLSRDIDRMAYVGQIHITSEVAVRAPNKGQLIVKGYACLPKDDYVEFSLIDGMGNDVKQVWLLTGQVRESNALDMFRREVPFTLRVPDDGGTYCLVASSRNGNRAGFLCLDPASRDYYLADRSPLFYRVAGLQEYKKRILDRGRMLSFVDPSDYVGISGPKFSVIVPLYKTPLPFFWDMVESVRSQLYRNWELILVNASPEDTDLAEALAELDDERICVIPLEENKGIAANTNAGIDAASGDFVVFFDHDDTLDPFALYKYAKATNEDASIDALYCDEDFLNEADEYVAPHFKSDFNLDLLRCHNYITHLLAVRTVYAKDLMLRSAFDGAQDYDFLLRLIERTRKIFHVQDVLYHWRISDTSTAKSAGNKGYADDAGRRALQEHLDRCGIDAVAETTDAACFYHVAYRVEGEPLVSIIIPNKDNRDVLRRCIDSVQEKSAYRNFEIVIVENNSVEPETFECYETLQKQYPNVRVITWDGPFNYSAINNYALPSTSGDYLLFLNNDTEVIEPRWLDAMLGLCQRGDVGAVGAKLLFPDDTVQHAGVMMIKCQSVNDVAGPIHVFSHLDRDDSGYMRRAVLVQDLSAVTAACMMTQRSVFEDLHGFDENFEVAFNDVDYCLRVREAGKLVVYTPDALLYHYESVSRGSDAKGKNAERFMREQGKLRTRWSSYYASGDPYHGPASTAAYLSEMP